MSATLTRPEAPLPADRLLPGVTERPTRLSEIVDTARFDDVQCASALRELADAKARIAAFEADVVKRLADLRPDLWDLNPDDPAARVEGWGSARTFNGVTEFFTDELATVLGISRTRADTLANTSLVLREQLVTTWEALADGRIDLPRAQALVTALGWQAPAVDPDVVAAVEREALQWAIAGEGPHALQNRAAALLLQHDAEAADRRRKEAQRHADVSIRHPADGMADLVVRLPAEVAAASRDTCDSYARMRKAAGDDRPIGQLRSLVAADLLLRPWDTSREPVTAHLTLLAPLPSLVDPWSAAGGERGTRGAAAPGGAPGGRGAGCAGDRGGVVRGEAPAPGPSSGEGAATDPLGDAGDPARGCHAADVPAGGRVDAQPVTAAHLREVLTQLGFCTADGLQVPSGSTVDIALTDPHHGALRAVVTPHRLRVLARRGCPEHPGPPGVAVGGTASPRSGGRPPATTGPTPGTGPPDVTADVLCSPTTSTVDCSCAVLDSPPATDTYRPTAAQRRFLDARDHTCRHPGCARPARWTDADHVVAWHEGGRTECSNLCNLCRRHHRLKTHAPGWVYAMTPDGRLSVTTPSGVTRTSAPPGSHQLVCDEDLLHPLETARPSPPELTGSATGPGGAEDDPPPF